MTAFLVIVLIIGNLLLFSGAVFGDLADNGIAWFFVIGAIAMDIYFIYLIDKGVSKSREQQRIAAENNRIAEATRKEQQRIAAENNRIAEVTCKVEALINKYTMTMMNSNVNITALQFQIAPEFINKEVVFTVKSYKERMAAIYDRYLLIANEIKRILACTGCISVDEKYSYLISHEDKLKQLKEEGDTCLSHLASYKIEILNDDRDILLEMKLAFRYLLNSKKCFSKSLTIKKFIVSVKPSDLMLFRYENEPVILFWEQYYFCLFSNVILVFDKKGVFSTAIDPSALKIVVKKETTSVSVRNGTARSNRYIADDSKCISREITETTWLHTCRDGSPDLRYSYNPRIEYRTDTYEYAVVEFIIADKKVSFSASSGEVGDAFEKSASNYLRKCNNRHDPIPEFLMLVKKIGGEDSASIDCIIQECNARTDAKNYFCKLISS